ncbi:SIR2 family protein [Nostoc sp. 2RC]|uniref:SIR2 family protein n=1 Tax=Nostoc sp. 2RC TaxID=2485484 RepID=UPI001626A34B|nr:SIR2 family protein [Nostoc sp. 2RC]MBC1237264.1 SIR2 family protein [Nostoc sp. 2RC]
MAEMTWLHLSDWHQKGKDFDRQVVRDALIRDIEEREKISPDLAKIDFIIFSGDVAHAGKKEEYEAAQENLFEPVLQATGLTAERLFIVPGNHDLDRSTFELLPDSILKPFDSDVQVKDWLTNQKKRDRLREPFEAYREFVTQYTHQPQPDYSSIRRLWIDEKRVALLGLNSALMAGRNKNESGYVDDYGKLIIGEPQLYDALKQIASDEVRIAVLHHPLEWIGEFERNRLGQRLQNQDGCHFLLCGHQHKSEVYQVAGTTGNCVVIPAGSSYDRRNYPNGYNFVHLNCDTRRGTVYLRLWIDDENCWYKHTAPSHEDGYVKFKLPQKVIAAPPPVPPPKPSTKIKVELEAHFNELIPKIKKGLVVPFLGADINLCDRPQDTNLIHRAWDWNPKGEYPPTSVELAAYLDQSHEYLKTVRCPLCDTETLPPACPIMTEFVTRLDLQHVSQYLNIQGEKTINQAITEIARHKYKPNRMHRFLAELPRLMDEMGYSARIRGGMASDATRYQLIVTTNFDSTLENAFVDANQPFDLVSYTAVGENDDSQLVKQFVHQQFEHEIEGDNESPVLPKCEIKPILPGIANENLDFSLNERPVILKLYGPADWPDHPRRSFAITEDHFIDYLAYADSKPKDILPGLLLTKLKSSHIWFLGYSLRYWHQRVILHRIWPERENRRTERWWAVHPKPDGLDKSFLWTANGVNLISETSLENYLDELNERLKAKW